MDINRKGILYEEFARFFENPSRPGLREILQRNVGEQPNCDFKEEWPSDSRLARHLLGFANSGGGGIVIGVAEREDHTFESRGLEMLKDKTDFFNGVRKFLPTALHTLLDIQNLVFEASEYPAIVGKKFQVVFVRDDPKHIPFVATREADGIRKNAIYVRRGTSTEETNYEELQAMINRRIGTEYLFQDLEIHLKQMDTLYDQLAAYQSEYNETDEVWLDKEAGEPDSFVEFLLRMRDEKEKLIRIALGISD